MQPSKPKRLLLRTLLRDVSLVIMMSSSTFSTAGSATRTYTKCVMSGEHRHSRWFQGTRSRALSRESAQSQPRYKMGDRVAVGCFVDSCRKCGPCREGLEQYCAEGPTLTYNAVERDGKNRILKVAIRIKS